MAQEDDPVTRLIIEGLLRVEAYNDQFRQPNVNGRYPICKSNLGPYTESNPGPVCERCGAPIPDTYDLVGPCPAVPVEQRWGEDWKGR